MEIITVILLFIFVFGMMLLIKYGDGGKQEVSEFIQMLLHPFKNIP